MRLSVVFGFVAQGILLMILSMSLCFAETPTVVAASGHELFVPTSLHSENATFQKITLPFYYRAVVSSAGPIIRLLGARSENASETDSTIWEIPDDGGQWRQTRTLPASSRGVFWSDATWGYIDRGYPRRILVFESGAVHPIEIPIQEGLVADDSVPLVWLKDKRAIVISVAKAGMWATDAQGVATNTVPPGEFTVEQISVDSGDRIQITAGEKPTVSRDAKLLAFSRRGQLWIRRMDNGEERRAYKPGAFEGSVSHFFWLADSDTLIFSVSTGSELFGEHTRCSEFVWTTQKVRTLWRGNEVCLAAVLGSFKDSLRYAP